MKILAIRAQNLASIERFDLDLDKGLLAETRIFAITGPTGAGKSTLLDAMCLALYDRAPRLSGTRGLPTGDLEVSALDPRSLVRRGAASASAEVDFEAEGGSHWRAIWEVWRAHKRASGKIQDQRMRLIALADNREHTGATKTETLAKIESLIGLGYSEFRRAVLLAQNDFASFLRAKPDERAELLERMTGTEIYAEISRGAFLRAKVEHETLLRLETDHKNITVLDDETRAALLQESADLRTKRSALEVEIAALARAIAWSEELARIEKDVAAAEVELRTATEAKSATAPLGIELARTIRAERARPAYEAATRARAAFVEIARASRTAQSRVDEVRAALSRAEAELGSAQESAAATRKRAVELAPELEKARALDVELREAQRAHDDAAKERTRSLTARNTARAAEEAIEKTIEREQRTLLELAGTIAEMRSTEKLAAQWPRWSAEIDRYPPAASIATIRASLDDATQALAAAEAEEAAARNATNEARRALEDQRKLDPPRALFEAVERLNTELASLQRMEELAAEAKKLSKDKSDEEKRGEENLDAGARLEPEVASLDAQIAALELAEKRSTLLREGEPCPLCGALDHPAAGAPAGDRAALVHELHAKRQALLRANETGALAKERSMQLELNIERIAGEWNSRRKTIEMLWVDSAILGRVGASRVAMMLPFEPTAKSAGKDAKTAFATLEKQRELILAAIARDEQAAGALDTLRDAATRAEARTRRLALELRAIEVLEVLRQPLSGRTGWETELNADPRAFQAKLALEVERYEALLRERVEVEEKLRERAIARERAVSEAKSAIEISERADAAAKTAQARLEEKARERKHLLQGRPVQEIANALDTEIRAVSVSVDAALAAVSLRSEETVRAEAEHASLAARAAEEEQRANTEDERLEQELAALDLHRPSTPKMEADLRTASSKKIGHPESDLHPASSKKIGQPESDLHPASSKKIEHSESASIGTSFLPPSGVAGGAESKTSAHAELARLLGRGRVWIEETERTLHAASDAVARKESTLAERARKLAEHRAQREELGPIALEDAPLRMAELRETLAAAVERAAEIALALAGDERARAEKTRLFAEITAKRGAVDRWAELNTLIGSADGKKLRTFAQGLTMESLLLQANLHLEELRPRYRLRRIGGSDLELEVVDGDMGDEIRAVSTLSGGESFLVSLALALALSTIAARDVRIQSLFVDEGFGSLDAEAMEVALATLDRLQAEGRTIAIISHVPQIAERIGYRVHVRPIGPGTSEVVVLAH